MIKHIVMWKFQPGKDAEVRAFLEGLRGLYGVIPQIREQEVGMNCAPGNYDAVLALCKAIRTDRVAVDYEV